MKAELIIATIGGAIAGVTSIGTLTGWILDKFEKSLEKIRKEITSSNTALKSEIKSDMQILSNNIYMKLDERIAKNTQLITLLKEELKNENNLHKAIQKSIFSKIDFLEKEIEKLR